jgi:hypothetical protein
LFRTATISWIRPLALSQDDHGPAGNAISIDDLPGIARDPVLAGCIRDEIAEI